MNKKKNVVIYGIGQQADLAHYYFEHDIGRDVIAYIIDFEVKDKRKNDLPVYYLNEFKNKLEGKEFEVFIAVGGVGLNAVREYYFLHFLKMGIPVTNCISDNTRIHQNTKIGLNTFIDDTTSIMPFCQIGNNFSTIKGFIGHHSVVEDNVSIMAAQIGGNVIIGNNCFIAMGATITSGVTIGEFSIIDSGSIINKNIPPHSVISTHKSIQRNIDSRRVKLLGISYHAFQDKLKKKVIDESGV
jgi:acetyltransferase-like isoleucine patch superfamily enzyme